MDDGKVHLILYPKGTYFEGKRYDETGAATSSTLDYLDLEISDAELLIREYRRSPEHYEQEAARSIEAALTEREYRIMREESTYETPEE